VDHPLRSDADASERVVRGIRAGLVASTTLALAVGAHLAGGGSLPDRLGLAALGTLTFVVAVVVARRALRAVTLLPLIGALELVLHVGLGALSARGVGDPGRGAGPGLDVSPGPGAMPGMVGAAHAAASTAASPTPDVLGHAASAMPMSGGGAVLMLVAHGVATLATVALLVAGDRAAGRTLVWFTSVLPRVRAVAHGTPVRHAAPVVVGQARVRPQAVERGGVGRRGPPVGRLALTS
jgi:hypothetical protein